MYGLSGTFDRTGTSTILFLFGMEGLSKFIRDFRQNGDFNPNEDIHDVVWRIKFIRDFRQNGDFNQPQSLPITLRPQFIRDFRQNGDFNEERLNDKVFLDEVYQGLSTERGLQPGERPAAVLVSVPGLSGTFDRTGTSTRFQKLSLK